MHDHDPIAKALEAVKQGLIEEHREGRKRAGATFVTIAIFWTAQHGGMAWWEIAMIVVTTYWGLHQVGGVKINWWS
jgi:hypothetical protein